jgi:hypothetical protein
MYTLTILFVAAALVLVVACSEDNANKETSSPQANQPTVGLIFPPTLPPTPSPTPPPPPPSPVISTAPSPPGTNRWSANAIWDFGEPAHSALWQEHCGAAYAGRYNPDGPGLDCVVEVMQAADAHPDAIAFLQEYGYFLSWFEELGKVDFGRGSAPWFDMGRPYYVLLLNGVPANVELNDKLQQEFAGTGQGPVAQTYSALLDQIQSPVPWVVHTLLASSEPRNGGQAITMYVPLKLGRPGPPLGYMPVEFVVSPSGILQKSALLPLKLP